MRNMIAAAPLALRRAALAAFDVLAAIAVALVLCAGFAPNAFAYVDPSVMTYTIQALAGVAVALSAVAGVALRRTRKALFKLLNIDEDARKDKDPVWTRTQESDFKVQLTGPGKATLAAAAAAAAVGAADAATAAGAASVATPAPKKTDAPLSWLKRLAIAAVAVALPAFTLGLVAPFEIIAGNADSLYFGLHDVAWIAVTVTVVGWAVVTLLLSAFRGKAFNVLAVLAVAFGLCCWAQAMFLNTGMPVMNGVAIDYWGQHAGMMIVSALVWAVILVGALVAALKKTGITRAAALAVSAVLVLVQGVGVVSLMGQDKASYFVTEDGLYEVSEGGNVIIFVLDHFDSKYLPAVQQEYPEALAEMTGFTNYEDCSGMMLPTLFAVPYMLTGQVPTEGQDIHDYYRSRYFDSSLIADLTSTGYSLGLYTSDIQDTYFAKEEVKDLFVDNTVNVHELDSLNISFVGAYKAMYRPTLFRDMPWILKAPFWFYTDRLNQNALDIESFSYDEAGNIVLGDPAQTPYTIDDPLRGKEIAAFGLTSVAGAGSVKLIHFNGAHVPIAMDYDGNVVSQDSVTRTEQAAGVLRMVGEYLAEMKRLGLYEGATIIITADHGDWTGSGTERGKKPDMVSTPILLVKEAGASAGEMVTSAKQVSHANMLATVVAAVGANPAAYGPTLAAAPDTCVRYFYHITTVEDRVDQIIQYRIDGDATVWSNWTETGLTWQVEQSGLAD